MCYDICQRQAVLLLPSLGHLIISLLARSLTNSPHILPSHAIRQLTSFNNQHFTYLPHKPKHDSDVNNLYCISKTFIILPAYIKSACPFTPL
jgi:hypothetical protein